MRYPSTPDGRYFVVRGRLWRCANPALPEPDRQRLVDDLMAARRAVGQALRSQDGEALARARQAVDGAKRGLGERGPVWWTDGAPDLNRRMVAATPYSAWWRTHSAILPGAAAHCVHKESSDAHPPRA